MYTYMVRYLAFARSFARSLIRVEVHFLRASGLAAVACKSLKERKKKEAECLPERALEDSILKTRSNMDVYVRRYSRQYKGRL